ncbi:MAG: TOBE domain-containing protein [Acidimicrobiales bacterium]
MPSYPLAHAAELLGVSPDTLRRWVDAGRVAASKDRRGRRVIDGEDLARFAQSLSDTAKPAGMGPTSARNRFMGLVTAVVKDSVMAKVDLVCGAHRVVSLMSREAADDLDLAPGVLAVASVKATQVVVELPRP